MKVYSLSLFRNITWANIDAGAEHWNPGFLLARQAKEELTAASAYKKSLILENYVYPEKQIPMQETKINYQKFKLLTLEAPIASRFA